MTPENNSYRWADTNLKWIAMKACETLSDGKTNNVANTSPNWWNGYLAIQRWFGKFNKNGNYTTDPATGRTYWVPDGSLHAILGHRAQTFQGPSSTGQDFADRCLRASSTSIGQSWLDACVSNEYYNYPFFSPGLEPAVLSAYQKTSGYNWFNESLKSPVVDPSACSPSTMGFWWNNAIVDMPAYSTWNTGN